MDSFIRSLHVEEVGVFRSLDIEFSSNVSILIGSNAVGKTSILRMICSCFSAANSQNLRRGENAQYWCDVQFENAIDRVGIATKNSKGVYRSFQSSWQQLAPQKGIRKTLAWGEESEHLIFAIGANRFFDYKRIDGMRKEDRGVAKRKHALTHNIESIEKINLPEIKQWMVNRYFIIEKDWAKNETENWNTLMNILPEIVPKEADFRFVHIERDLEPVFSVNGQNCYLEELSSGYKSFLAILFSIVDWCEGVFEDERALIGNAIGTVLIDEIDAHLHPEWQLIIIKSIKRVFPRIQFIVTTHSPLVLASADSNQIIQIPRHDGILDLKPIPRSFSGWQIDYILDGLMNLVIHSNVESSMLERIDGAFEKRDIDSYDKELNDLKGILNENDPIIRYYEIKRSILFLSN
ncbi:MAG: AAA family ATPase [Taibaiella sp.]|nr:AAA family ATPase [Taibaiella sp.]